MAQQKYREVLPCFEEGVRLGDDKSKEGIAICNSHIAYIFRFIPWLGKLGSPKPAVRQTGSTK